MLSAMTASADIIGSVTSLVKAQINAEWTIVCLLSIPIWTELLFQHCATHAQNQTFMVP